MNGAAASTDAVDSACRSALMPARDQVVIRHILERHASTTPDLVAVVFDNADAWTWWQCRAEMRRSVARLRKAGVRRGDKVLIFLPNGAGWLRAWWGVTGTGATMVPVHTAYVGDMLRHICESSGATVAIVDDGFKERMQAIGVGVQILSPQELTDESSDDADLDAPIEPWDIATINYTSGTTGKPKGAVTAYLQTYVAGRDCFNRRAKLRSQDRWLVDLPMFHVAAQQISVAALSIGASIAMHPVFSGSRYWEIAEKSAATHSLLAGSMGNFLLAQPPSASDRHHSLKTMVAAPILADYQKFMERFGIERMVTAFGQTESGCATTVSTDDNMIEGTCGRPRDGIEIRLVDDNDLPVAIGDVGEMALRTECPWELTIGYFGDPAATAKLWRNGWLHTGDNFRRDEAGNYFFVDRLRDSLRRRGENVSSFMVETSVNQHEGIVESACIAVPSEHGEDEIMVFVVPAKGVEINFVNLSENLAGRMPYFMVPRYFELVEQLPKTTTMRTQKFILRERGVSPRTWDREAAGIFVTRSGLKKKASE